VHVWGILFWPTAVAIGTPFELSFRYR